MASPELGTPVASPELRNSGFRAAFDAARGRIQQMDVQFVEEMDPVRQTILEVFTAVETGAVFNDFGNH
jgi:hypothetical protein